MPNDKPSRFAELPSVDAVMRTETARRMLPATGPARLSAIARKAVESLRESLAGNDGAVSRAELLREAEDRLDGIWNRENSDRTRRVINATGVIVHTNLGRAPLSENAQRAVVGAACYCNLEFDLGTGKRGPRGARAERLIAELAGAEAAVVVNNCAAATLLVLTALGSGGEVVVSRGELVEIGGDFRIPDVMRQSGARLREVGTTNRTKLSDFENAVSDSTLMFLRVHPSNYRIVGFTAAPELADLAELARQNGIVVYEDAGSGAVCDLSEFGIGDEPLIAESVRAGADVVSFSGDKLLGGPQSGIIVGRTEFIERIRRHPLFRALRASKVIYAALEATLDAFARGSHFDEIPVLAMLSADASVIRERSERLAEELRVNPRIAIGLEPGESVIGGGAAPLARRPTFLLSLEHESLSAAELDGALRAADPPVIARIEGDLVLLDLRTVALNDENDLLRTIAEI